MYYRGDYYQGDYYQGFPFAAALAPLAKRVGGAVLKKAIPRAGAAIGRVFGGRAGRVVKAAGKIGGAGAVFEAGSQIARRRMGGGDEMGGGRRYRRMNVTNVKALRRAIRRARGFAKLARSVMTFPIQKPPKGRALFKKRGKR